MKVLKMRGMVLKKKNVSRHLKTASVKEVEKEVKATWRELWDVMPAIVFSKPVKKNPFDYVNVDKVVLDFLKCSAWFKS